MQLWIIVTKGFVDVFVVFVVIVVVSLFDGGFCLCVLLLLLPYSVTVAIYDSCNIMITLWNISKIHKIINRFLMYIMFGRRSI